MNTQETWKMSAEYVCIRDEQLGNQSSKIAELETRADFKDKRIDELNETVKKMDDKLDKVLEGFNELKLQSIKDDNQLDLRLKAIETELAVQKQTTTDNHNRVSSLLAIVGVGLTIITILINVYFNMLH